MVESDEYLLLFQNGTYIGPCEKVLNNIVTSYISCNENETFDVCRYSASKGFTPIETVQVFVVTTTKQRDLTYLAPYEYNEIAQWQTFKPKVASNNVTCTIKFLTLDGQFSQAMGTCAPPVDGIGLCDIPYHKNVGGTGLKNNIDEVYGIVNSTGKTYTVFNTVDVSFLTSYLN